MHPLMI